MPSYLLNLGSDVISERLLFFYNECMAMSPDNFARLFRSSSAFYNNLFELMIDDIHYISFPMESTRGVISMFSVVVAFVREEAMRRTLRGGGKKTRGAAGAGAGGGVDEADGFAGVDPLSALGSGDEPCHYRPVDPDVVAQIGRYSGIGSRVE